MGGLGDTAYQGSGGLGDTSYQGSGGLGGDLASYSDSLVPSTYTDSYTGHRREDEALYGAEEEGGQEEPGQQGGQGGLWGQGGYGGYTGDPAVPGGYQRGQGDYGAYGGNQGDFGLYGGSQGYFGGNQGWGRTGKDSIVAEEE